MDIPQFGSKVPGKLYVPRPGAYAVIFNRRGELAAVCAYGEYFLPGGGIRQDETPEEALIREVIEETGLTIRIIQEIGRANEYVYSTRLDRYYNKLGIFYLAELSAEPNDDERDASWITRRHFLAKAFHESHIWAIQQVAR